MQEFLIAPAASKALWFMLLIPALILVLVMMLLGAAALGSRTARFEVSPDGLRLKGDLYGRLIPLNQLKTGLAQRVSLADGSEMKPTSRTLGTGLPGYQAGWFRLRNGEKALLYLTDANRAVYVPTTAGYGILLSPADPDAFLSALQRAGGEGAP